ncbi:MAG: ArsA family ATPase [Candidatus Kariarchaeaceae archaeon]|jgi:arsenite-transporting ATPase
MAIKGLIDNLDRRFILVGGKGGVGKSSISASLATSFASHGQKTLIISTDPAHSISDSFDQDLSGGVPVPITGIDNLFGMEINPEEVGTGFKSLAGIGEEDTETVDNIMGGLSQLGFGEVNDLLDTMPPGIDEALALAKVIQFIRSEEYADFKRIIFDTAPTGHTLRMLALPDFLDSFMGKMIKVRVRMNNAASAFKSLLGMEADRDNTLEIMEALKESMGVVRDLFRDKVKTEFMIATIPTIMAINESERLRDQLSMEDIQVNHVVVNQVLPENTDCKFCSVRAKGQKENLNYIRQVFHDLNVHEIEYFDHEVRGKDALLKMGSLLLSEN